MRISAEDVVLEPLTVTARRQPAQLRRLELAGFYARERMNFGQFIRREDLDRGAPRVLSDVLRRYPGIRIVPTIAGPQVMMSRATSSEGGCFPRILLDNIGYELAGTETLDDVIRPDNLVAVEVYRGAAQVPAEVRGLDQRVRRDRALVPRRRGAPRHDRAVI